MVILEKRVPGLPMEDLSRFAQRAQALAHVYGEVSVLIAGNRRLRDLNRRFRRKNTPTDVLSFPGHRGGDIAISLDIARENARLYGHDFSEELKVLILHGMLHLAGYDHESDDGQMAAREMRLRAQLRLPASLIDRTRILAAKIANGRAEPQRKQRTGKRSATARRPGSRRP